MKKMPTSSFMNDEFLKVKYLNYVTPCALEILNEADGIDINSLERHEAKKNNISGVYFLFKEDELVYVGCSTNIIKRVETHFSGPDIDYDSFSYVECHKKSMKLIERYLINKYLPKHNTDLITKKIKKYEVPY